MSTVAGISPPLCFVGVCQRDDTFPVHVTIVSIPNPGAKTTGIYPPRDALREAGWGVDVVHPEGFSVTTSSTGVHVFLYGRPFDTDVVFMRRARDEQLVHAFHTAGIPVVNGPDAMKVAGCKWATSSLLASNGIAHVPSRLLYPGNTLESTATDRVVKLTHGSHAHNVHLLPAHTVMLPIDEPLVVQPLVDYADDWRVLVAGSKVVAWAKRVPPPGEWRANLRFGASWTAPDIPVGVADVSCAAVDALGLDYGGVDVLVDESGPQVVEVNANPGWQGVWPLWGETIYELYQVAVRSCLLRVKDSKVTGF